MKPLIVILGPTASGKTDLSLKIAKFLKTEIISADSRQIYKGMEIATDIIPKDKRKNIPHHLLAITTIDKPLTLAEYKEKALKKIAQIHKKGKIPILAGGTGLYISSIIENYDIPKIPPDKKLREELLKEAKKKGQKFLHKKLAKLDPQAAKAIHPNNIRYVIRALEVANYRNNAHLQAKQSKYKGRSENKFLFPRHPQFNILLFGIKIPREELYKRIEKRVDEQIKKGLVDEVKKLLKKYSENFPAMSSLGVKEIIPCIKGKMTLVQCVEILKKNTRRYAKRQMTWFRRYDNVQWLTEKDIKTDKWKEIQKSKKFL